MKILMCYIDHLAKNINDIYIFTKTVSDCIETFPKGSLAIKTPKKDQYFCIDRILKVNDGSLPIFSLDDWVTDGTLRPLTKDERYEVLYKYAQVSIKKIYSIKRKIDKLDKLVKR
jgi:hypothetical protein